MRVISGKYSKRKLEGFNIIGTRPTMDRVKESMFALIQNNIKDSICLDLFSGSGAIGIEALSNGAKSCYFVDINKEAINVLSKNINTINIKENYYIIKKDYNEALKYFYDNNIKFDLIFLDPPYRSNFISIILNLILKYDLLIDNGLIVCEYEDEVVVNNSFDCIKSKKYGRKNIDIYAKRK